jgi:L-methionine (R)-S-oxide reductase
MNNLQTTATDRAGKYRELIPQLKALLDSETDWIANLANTAASIYSTFGFHWVGFYLVKGKELVLGPFQGPVACTRIGFGRGVCGTAWKEGCTLLVPDVDAFPGHIACSALSRSEVVVPVFYREKVVAVLDIDSSVPADFSDTDQKGLEEIGRMLSDKYHSASSL